MESQNRETIAKKERMGSHLDSNSTEMTMEISSSNMASASRMIAHSQYMSNSESSLTDNNEPSSVSDEKVTVRKTRFCNKESSQKSLSLGDLADNNAQRKGGEHQKRRPQFDDRENSCGSLGSTDETARSGSRPGLRQSRWSSRHSFPKSDSESMLNASQASLMAFFAKPPSLENTESTVSSPFRRFRLFCGTVVEAPIVQVAIIVLIVINALLMGVGTFDFVTEHPNVDRKFNIVDRTFLAIFSVESALQLIYRGVYLFLDGWLVFDFVIVIASWSLESLQIVRAFRIFRAFRLITRM